MIGTYCFTAALVGGSCFALGLGFTAILGGVLAVALAGAITEGLGKLDDLR